MNVIYNALFFSENNVKSPNLKLSVCGGGRDLYLKSCYVSLKSAKLNNPNCSVVLVTNGDLPEQFTSLLSDAGIEIKHVSFTTYRMPAVFKWEYAFYKLEALAYMVEQDEYENILALDTDTYCNADLDQLWKECKYNVPLLMPLDVDCETPVRRAIINDYLRLYGEEYPVVQLGGEFIAGSRLALKNISTKLYTLYHKIKAEGFEISENSGDEALISIVMAKEPYNIARPFIRRYWGRRAYYNVSSDWGWTPIWHLPAEKNYGLIKMYDYLIDKKKLPSSEYAAKLFNLPRQNKWSLSMLKYYIFNVLNR